AHKGKDLIKKLEDPRQKPDDQRTPLDKKLVRLGDLMRERQHQAMMMREGLFDRHINPRRVPLFRIENDQVLGMLGLPKREGLRYSFREIVNEQHFSTFQKKVQEARKRDE